VKFQLFCKLRAPFLGPRACSKFVTFVCQKSNKNGARDLQVFLGFAALSPIARSIEKV
jgi:hypothetical protein